MSRWLPAAETVQSFFPSTPTPQSIYYIGYPAILALGWYITWVNTKRVEAVKGDIARVSEQLKEFYGPLQSIASATEASNEAMIREFMDGSGATAMIWGILNADVERPPEAIRKAWEQMRHLWHAELAKSVGDRESPAGKHFRLWAVEVMQPLNERALEI